MVDIEEGQGKNSFSLPSLLFCSLLSSFLLSLFPPLLLSPSFLSLLALLPLPLLPSSTSIHPSIHPSILFPSPISFIRHIICPLLSCPALPSSPQYFLLSIGPFVQARHSKDTTADSASVAQAVASSPHADLDHLARSLQFNSGSLKQPHQDQPSHQDRHQSVCQERELQSPPQLLSHHPLLQRPHQQLLGREYLNEARSKTASSPPHTIFGMLGPGPGPAPTPSLTLPPLSELDKSLGSESEHRLPHHHSPQSSAVAAGQPRSQSSDPHLHQHLTQQQQQQHQHQQQQQQQQQQQLPPPPPQSSSTHHRSGNDAHSHLYVDHHSHRPQQPQSPPGQKMYQYDQMNRYYSSTGFPADVHMSSAMTGRSDPSAPREIVHSPSRQQQQQQHQQQHQHHEFALSTTGVTKGTSLSSAHSYDSTTVAHGGSDSRTQQQSAHPHSHHHRHEPSGYQSGGESANNTDAGAKSGGEGNGKASKGAGRGSAGTEHSGRNSSKRAAQNRAAQRAFRQRKDLYVRSLEHKAKLLELAEAEIAALMARNQELEAELAATLRSAGRVPSSIPPLEDDVAAASSLIRAANASMAASASSVSAGGPPYHIREREGDQEWDYGRPRDRDMERDREWSHDSRSGPPSATLPSGPLGPYDPYYHSSGLSSGPSSTRPTIARHSSTQHLHHAYNASSPPLSSGSFKHLSLSSNKSSRYESDQDIEGGPSGQNQHPPRPHRHLHRHPSESSLNLGRTGTFGSFGSYRDEQQPAVPSLPRLHGDFRSDMVTSPPSQSKSPMSATFAQRSPRLHEPSSASSIQHFPSSPLSPTHERMSLYGAARGSAGSVSSPISAHGEPVTYDLGKKRPSEGTVSWNGGSGDNGGAGSEAYHSHPHYRSAPLSDGGAGQIYRPAIKKQSSWSSLSDRHRHPSVKKQPSWSSISEHRSHQYHASLRETAQYQRELSARAASSPGATGSLSASASPAMSSSGPLLGFVPKQHGSMTPSASALTAAAEAARSAAAAANAANAGQVSLPPVSSLSLSSSRRDHAMTSAGEETDEYSEPLSPMQHQQQRFQAQPHHQHGYQQQQQQHHQSPQPYQHSQFQQQALHHRASASSLSSPGQGERRPSMPETGSVGSSSS